MSESAESLMLKALAEAKKGTRKVRPNPRVGCVFELSNGTLIEGHHSYCGGPHAERVALSKVIDQGLDPSGARVAVTLEPCSHTGRTGPCVDLLIDAKVKEVIIPFCDPNPLVAGKGVKKLQNAGIKVTQGILTEEAYLLNREWLWAQKLRRPFVTLKIATSANGVGIANDRKWITSAEARVHAMALRARVDVLITSGETLRRDDPFLTTRSAGGQLLESQPRVIGFSKTKDLGLSQNILKHPQWEWHESKNLLESLEILFSQGVFDVMLECGPSLAKAFVDSGLVDELWHYENKDFLDGRKYDLEFLSGFALQETLQIDADNVLKRSLRKDCSQVACFAF